MKVLDLFSGIGGFSLGLERAGMTTVAFCEIDPYCRKVLRKHWPDVPIYDDVRTLTADALRRDGIADVDVICGGFPCQDISEAGAGAGLAGERSGLWREYARVIGDVRPQWVVVENVSGLLFRGLGDVLGDLASLGYDALWESIPASAVGAPHQRDRIWIVAHPQRLKSGERSYANEKRRWAHEAKQIGMGGGIVAHSNTTRHEGSGRELPRWWSEFARSAVSTNGQWACEPELDRVVDGLPNWSHRVAALGNAVVPQIPELIGRAIMSLEPSR